MTNRMLNLKLNDPIELNTVFTRSRILAEDGKIIARLDWEVGGDSSTVAKIQDGQRVLINGQEYVVQDVCPERFSSTNDDVTVIFIEDKRPTL